MYYIGRLILVVVILISNCYEFSSLGNRDVDGEIPSLLDYDKRKLHALHNISSGSGVGEKTWQELLNHAIADHRTHQRDGHSTDNFVNNVRIELANLLTNKSHDPDEQINVGLKFKVVHEQAMANGVTASKWRYLILKALASAHGHSVQQNIINAKEILQKSIYSKKRKIQDRVMEDQSGLQSSDLNQLDSVASARGHSVQQNITNAKENLHKSIYSKKKKIQSSNLNQLDSDTNRTSKPKFKTSPVPIDNSKSNKSSSLNDTRPTVISLVKWKHGKPVSNMSSDVNNGRKLRPRFNTLKLGHGKGKGNTSESNSVSDTP